jgi:hypothetical protein
LAVLISPLPLTYNFGKAEHIDLDYVRQCAKSVEIVILGGRGPIAILVQGYDAAGCAKQSDEWFSGLLGRATSVPSVIDCIANHTGEYEAR